MLLLLLLLLELAAEVSELAAFFNAAIDAFTSRCRADKSYMNHNISYIFVSHMTNPSFSTNEKINEGRIVLHYLGEILPCSPVDCPGIGRSHQIGRRLSHRLYQHLYLVLHDRLHSLALLH